MGVNEPDRCSSSGHLLSRSRHGVLPALAVFVRLRELAGTRAAGACDPPPDAADALAHLYLEDGLLPYQARVGGGRGDDHPHRTRRTASSNNRSRPAELYRLPAARDCADSPRRPGSASRGSGHCAQTRRPERSAASSYRPSQLDPGDDTTELGNQIQARSSRRSAAGSHGGGEHSQAPVEEREGGREVKNDGEARRPRTAGAVAPAGGRRLEADEALLGLVHLLAEPVLLRLGAGPRGRRRGRPSCGRRTPSAPW